MRNAKLNISFTADDLAQLDVYCGQMHTDHGVILTRQEAIRALVSKGLRDKLNITIRTMQHPVTHGFCLDATEIGFCQTSKKIQAIKCLRNRSNLLLVEAKEVVDIFCAANHL